MNPFSIILQLVAIMGISGAYKDVFNDHDYKLLSSLQCTPREGWVKLEQSEGSVVYTNSTDNHDVSFISCLHFPGISPERLFKLSTDLQIRKKIDSSIKEANVVEKYDKNNYLINWVFQSPVDSVQVEPIQLLDYMQIRRFENQHKYLIAFKGAQDSRVMHESGTIWARTVFAGYSISPDPNDPQSSSYMVVIVHLLPGGNIPEETITALEKLGPESFRDDVIDNS